jgi:hypothetical protein
MPSASTPNSRCNLFLPHCSPVLCGPLIAHTVPRSCRFQTNIMTMAWWTWPTLCCRWGGWRRWHEYAVAEGSVIRQGCPAGAFAYIGGAARARQFLLGLLRPSPPGAQAPHRRREKTSGNRPSSSANGIAVAGFSSRERKQEVGVEFFFPVKSQGCYRGLR